MILLEKYTTTQTFTVKDPNDGTETKKSYMPVPYNMQFELAIMSKLNDDALQIVEQILPYFQPAYNVTVELVEALQEKEIFLLSWKTLPCRMTTKEILLVEEFFFTL